MTILGMKRRFEKLDTNIIVEHSMQENEESLRDLNLEQMYDGKTNQGTDIRPLYIEDPYWNDKGGIPAAQAYSDWKDRITPNPRRTKGVPNLFINGFFHSSISVKVAGQKVVFSSSFNQEPDIRERFKNIYGLGGNHKSIFLHQYLSPVIKDKIFAATGLKMK